MTLYVGELISTRSIRHHFKNDEGSGWLKYCAEKGKNMVFLYLGQEPIDGSCDIDADSALKKMGWSPPKNRKV